MAQFRKIHRNSPPIFPLIFFLPLQNFFAAAAHDSPADLAGNPQIGGTKHVCLAAAHILFR